MALSACCPTLSQLGQNRPSCPWLQPDQLRCRCAGASIIWEKNWLIRELAAAAGLERAKTSDGLIAVYDGRELIFRQSSWRLLTLLRLIFRYWFSWLNFQSAPAAMWEKFQTIYTLLDNGKTFDTPEMLLKQIGLYDLTQVRWLRCVG